MPNLGWRDAVTSPQAMHYADIAEAIVKRELRALSSVKLMDELKTKL